MSVEISIKSKISSGIRRSRLCSFQTESDLGLPTNNQGEGGGGTKLGTLSPLNRFEQGPSCSPHRLVSQSTILRKRLHMVVEGIYKLSSR